MIERVELRLEPREKTVWAANARNLSLSISDYIRLAVESFDSRTDDTAPRALPASPAVVKPEPTVPSRIGLRAPAPVRGPAPPKIGRRPHLPNCPCKVCRD